VTPHKSPADASPTVFLQTAVAPGEDAQKPVADIKPVQESSPGQHGADQTVSAAPAEDQSEDSGKGNVVIQVGVFREKPNAEKLLKRLRARGYDAYLETRAAPNLGDLYRVRLQAHPSEDTARDVMVRLEKEEGINDSFILDRIGRQDQ
jgi:cell division septation protein DedD